MERLQLYADPNGLFVHEAILGSCRKYAERIALVDTSAAADTKPASFARLSYGRLGELIESTAKGFVASGVKPGDVIAIFLFNCWEFAVAYHAATLCGAAPTFLNPSYRQREVCYQLTDSGARILVTDGSLIRGLDLTGVDGLKQIYCVRKQLPGALPFHNLQQTGGPIITPPDKPPNQALAALPYSSGTTGLPKGVMLSHQNLLTNVFQFLAPGEAATLNGNDTALCFLPLYHIYGLNVVLNPALISGGTIVLMPRFDVETGVKLISDEGVTWIPLVPPVMNLFCRAAQEGGFPQRHKVRFAKSGAAPLASGLAQRFTAATGIPIKHGYGMTEASPLTHAGFLEAELYFPESIGRPAAFTDCRLVDCDSGNEDGSCGELVMRGPQFMLGYWNAPEATAFALRDGWYWSGDIATRDGRGFFKIVDRVKEMIKFNGFPISPAEVEAVLLEHPLVNDSAVLGRADEHAGEIPYAFVVLSRGAIASSRLEHELCDFVRERLTAYKQPQGVKFVDSIPRNPSGKILRRELRSQL